MFVADGTFGVVAVGTGWATSGGRDVPVACGVPVVTDCAGTPGLGLDGTGMFGVVVAADGTVVGELGVVDVSSGEATFEGCATPTGCGDPALCDSGGDDVSGTLPVGDCI